MKCVKNIFVGGHTNGAGVYSLHFWTDLIRLIAGYIRNMRKQLCIWKKILGESKMKGREGK